MAGPQNAGCHPAAGIKLHHPELASPAGPGRALCCQPVFLKGEVIGLVAQDQAANLAEHGILNFGPQGHLLT